MTPKDSSAPAVNAQWRSAPTDSTALRRLLIALFEPEVQQDEGRRGGDADAATP
jgi:hypothetical protein